MVFFLDLGILTCVPVFPLALLKLIFHIAVRVILPKYRSDHLTYLLIISNEF